MPGPSDAKSAVRAALLELIEADKVATPGPWVNCTEEHSGWWGKFPANAPECVIESRHPSKVDPIDNAGDAICSTNDDGLATEVEACNAELIVLARNLAPGMARIILKMLDENECNWCGSKRITFNAVGMDDNEKDPRVVKVPCPRCAARWQEWAEILGVK